jgi:Flp pilus assembly protein TadG
MTMTIQGPTRSRANRSATSCPASSRRPLQDAAGQSLVELAIVLPLLVVLVLGVIDVSYALLDEHIVTKLSREGANLLSRDASLDDAYSVLNAVGQAPIDFSTHSKVIFTVVKHGSATGTSNYDKNIVYQRFERGAGTGTSQVTCGACSGTFGSSPDYTAANSDSDTTLQVTGGLANTSLSLGSYLYIAEIFTAHSLLTPFDKFGVTLPSQLYSIAYF